MPNETYAAFDTTEGKFKVKLAVTDNRGASDPVTHTVTVAP